MQNFNALCEKEAYVEIKESFSYRFIKRFFDIFLSIIILILLSPVLIITAIAIKVESEGNIIFVQDRVGYKGKIFKMYKFRSMCNNAEDLKDNLLDKNEMDGPMFKMRNDPRITKVGITTDNKCVKG